MALLGPASPLGVCCCLPVDTLPPPTWGHTTRRSLKNVSLSPGTGRRFSGSDTDRGAEQGLALLRLV